MPKYKLYVRNILTNQAMWSEDIKAHNFGHVEEIILDRFKEIGKAKQFKIEKIERSE